MDMNIVFNVAKKTVLDKKLTAEEQEQKDQIFEDINLYRKYCCLVQLMDMLERRGCYAPGYCYKDVRQENQIEVSMEQKATMKQD